MLIYIDRLRKFLIKLIINEPQPNYTLFKQFLIFICIEKPVVFYFNFFIVFRIYIHIQDKLECVCVCVCVCVRVCV